MVNRVDISSQPLTPSAPNVSGAISAIKSQADIAATIFGGLEKGIELKKKSTLERASEEGQALQEEALTKYQTSKVESQQAASDYLTAQSDMADLAGFGITPEVAEKQGKVIPAQAQMLSAATRLKRVQEAGGFRQEEYFTRVKDLVDKYAAEYPSSKEEIRRVVGEATGLPGADLWAQQQFIRQMFSPKEAKENSDKLAARAREEEYALVAKWNKVIPPTQLAQIQQEDPEGWAQVLKPALEAEQAETALKAAQLRQQSLTAGADPLFRQRGELIRQSATLTAGVASTKFLNDRFQDFQVLEKKLASGSWAEEDNASATVLFNGLRNTVTSAFARNRLEALNSLGSDVSTEVKTRVLADLKDQEEALTNLLNTSSQAQTIEAMKLFTAASDKTFDKRIKLTNAYISLLGQYGSDTTIRNALANPETDEKGNETPYWTTLKAQAPGLVPLIKEFKSLIEGSSLDAVPYVAKNHPVAVVAQDAVRGPGATPVTLVDKKHYVGGTQQVALMGADTVARYRDSKLRADVGIQIGSELAKDINVTGTALSNLSLGHGLNIINQNAQGFTDFYSKLTPEQKAPVSVAVNESYIKSLESARRGIGVVSSDYQLKTPLQVGVRPDGVIGIKPPPKEWVEPAKGTGRSYMSLPANIRKYYKDPTKYYGGEQMVFKPEFVEEGNKWARAMEEWENKYLPRVQGAARARSILEGKDFIATSQDITRLFESGKPMTGFFSLDTSQTSEQNVERPTEATRVELQGVTSGEASVEKLMALAQLPTTPDDTRKKILLILDDMRKAQQGP